MPFELGRPLGRPNDVAFQTRVLQAVFELLEAPSGPVLEDFPEDVPHNEDSLMGWACPINLPEETRNVTDSQALLLAFRNEMNRMRSWYDLGVKRRGRTTFGLSGLDPAEIPAFLNKFLDYGIPENPRDDIPPALLLKLAVDDLKAYYLEAATAQPGEREPTSGELSKWFWSQTIAAKVLLRVKEACLSSSDPMLKTTGKLLIVPML